MVGAHQNLNGSVSWPRPFQGFCHPWASTCYDQPINQIWSLCLHSRNVRWPRGMLAAPGESRWVCRWDRRTDGRTPDRYIALFARRGQRNKSNHSSGQHNGSTPVRIVAWTAPHHRPTPHYALVVRDAVKPPTHVGDLGPAPSRQPHVTHCVWLLDSSARSTVFR